MKTTLNLNYWNKGNREVFTLEAPSEMSLKALQEVMKECGLSVTITRGLQSIQDLNPTVEELAGYTKPSPTISSISDLTSDMIQNVQEALLVGADIVMDN